MKNTKLMESKEILLQRLAGAFEKANPASVFIRRGITALIDAMEKSPTEKSFSVIVSDDDSNNFYIGEVSLLMVSSTLKTIGVACKELTFYGNMLTLETY